MKKLMIWIYLFLTVACMADVLTEEGMRQAFATAMDQAQASFKQTPLAARNIAVLPIPGDSSTQVAGALKSMISSCGFTCVEGKDDPMWDEIIKEFAWDEKKDDILDPLSLARFGKLQGVQVLMYGTVRAAKPYADHTYVELELHATEVATRRHVWGGLFAGRFYGTKDMLGIVSLTLEEKQALKDCFNEALASLKSFEVNAGLQKIHSLSVIPLAGDIDRYITGLAEEMLTQTNHLPKDAQIPLLSQIRLAQKEGLVDTDGIFYGAVRDLSKTPVKEIPDDDKIISSYDIRADIQMFIEECKTGLILWSRTYPVKKTILSSRKLTEDEMDIIKAKRKRKQEKEEAEWKAKKELAEAEIKAKQAEAEAEAKAKADAEKAEKEAERAKLLSPENIRMNITEELMANWKTYAAWVLGVIVGLVVLVIGGKLIVAYLNNGRVR